jgi:hypothetical protein
MATSPDPTWPADALALQRRDDPIEAQTASASTVKATT